VLLGLASAVVIVAGLKGAAGLIGMTFLTLVLAIAVHPLQAWLARRMPGWLSTVLCLVAVYVALVALGGALVVSTAQFVSLLPAYEARFDVMVAQLNDRLAGLGISEQPLRALTSSLNLSNVTGLVTNAMAGVLGVTSNLLLVIALLFLLTIDGSRFPRLLSTAAQSRPAIVRALVDFVHSTRRYMIVATVFGLIVAILDMVALIILGIPAPVLWGLLAFLTNYIPNVGFVIGLIPPAILGLLSGGPGVMIAVVVVYCLINLIIQSGIQNRVVGGSVGISPSLTFLSLVFWSWVIGPLGAVLAIPLSLLVRAVLVDADPQSRWLRPLVANKNTEDAPVDPDTSRSPGDEST